MELPADIEETLRRFAGDRGRVLALMRPPALCMTAPALSAMKATRLSFVSLLSRRMIAERWRIERLRFVCDAEGDGHGLYAIQAGEHRLTYLARSFAWDGIERAGRRSDGAHRNMFGAIFLGTPDEDRIAREMRALELRDVDSMRTGPDVTGWTPANRSGQYFEHVVGALAEGRQPDPAMLGSGTGYLLRNGGYLGSGRHGSLSLEGFPQDHPLRHPFFADLFGLFLVRQVSIDLVNGIAAARSPKAVRLSPEIARYIGVGNSSGQGMCVALQRWPEWVATWLLVREIALAYAKSQTAADPARRARLSGLLGRAAGYYATIRLQCEDYVVPTPVLAANLATVKSWLAEEPRADASWADLAERVAATFDAETAEQVNALLIETYPEFSDAVAAYVPKGMQRDRDLDPSMSVGALRALLRSGYDWALRYDMRQSKTRQHFWYHSADNGEQRRGERIVDPHEEFESFIDHVGLAQRLACTLAAYGDDTTVAEVIADTPDLAYGVARVQYLSGLPYAEIRDNLIHRDFLPAHLIRFFLSVLGMECTNPLSIRYVRGVFFQGMPLPEELARGADPDWAFPAQPAAERLARAAS